MPTTHASVSVVRRNNVHVTGPEDAPVLVLAHGFGCDQTMWRHLRPDLARDHRVITFDYVGSGQSTKAAFDPARYATLRGYAQDVLDIIETLDLRDVTLIGHSVSSMIGALAAIAAPTRFARLVMVGPSPCYVDKPPYRGGFSQADIDGLLDLMDRNFLGWATTLGGMVARATEHPEVAAELTESFCSTDPRFLRSFAEVTFRGDNRDDLPRVPVPSLVLQCTDDAVAPEEVGEYCARRLPHASLHKLAATGHCPHLSDPAETIAAIRTYLPLTHAARA